MIDFHSHILPGIDDGSPDVSTSLRMVAEMKRQGIETILATSHFYATKQSPEQFLFNRYHAFERLSPQLSARSPEILLGAEVLFFPGISRMRELPDLCVEGTNLLLLEMPFKPWSENTVQEVKSLASSGEYTILLAHIERYYSQQPRRVWDEFLDYGMLMQANADFFLSLFSRHKALRLLKESRIHLLGTDAHNMTTRAPRMQEAVSVIRKYLGSEFLSYMDDLGHHLLCDALE